MSQMYTALYFVNRIVMDLNLICFMLQFLVNVVGNWIILFCDGFVDLFDMPRTKLNEW